MVVIGCYWNPVGYYPNTNEQRIFQNVSSMYQLKSITMKHFLTHLSIILLVLASLPLAAQVTEGEIALYTAMVEQDRNMKNESFKNPEGSPLLVNDLATFEGLFYYDVDVKYKVTATLTMLEDQKTITLSTTNGGKMDVIQYGTVSFELDGKTHTLSVFRDQNLPELASKPGQLFIPFKDKTSGDQTNANGRYLALSVPQDSNTVELDLNKAFNPYSAYNSEYVSVIPPDENGLDATLVTGERKYEDR